MEVRIRLQRAGNKSAKSRYNYRIVAMSKAKARDSRHLEVIGHYDPSRKPSVYDINVDKLEKWLNDGAQMSETVNKLVKKFRKNK